jgi:hypothetical protein
MILYLVSGMLACREDPPSGRLGHHATVTEIFAADREYVIHFPGDPEGQPGSFAVLSWTGRQPAAGTADLYGIRVHLDATRHVMAAPEVSRG